MIQTSRVVSIKKINRGRVINLNVIKNHTFITKNGIVTHNCDYATPQLQAVLRAGIEEVSSNCTFILTCNNKNKIIDAIHSRCAVFDFNITNKEKPKLASQFFKRIIEILKLENIDFDQAAIAELVKKHFPDYRRILNELQRYSINGKIDTGILINLTEESYKSLINSLKSKNFTEVRQWVGANTDIETSELFRKLYDHSIDYLELSSIPQLVLLLADYGYKESFSVDQEINKMACMVEIMSSCVFK